MKSPQTRRFERIFQSQSYIDMMPPSPPLIAPQGDFDIIHPDFPSSPPPEVPESLISSPQGVPPIPLASSSPIPAANTSSFQIKSANSPAPNLTVPIVSPQDVPIVSQAITSILSLCQEDLNTPKAKEEEVTENTKIKKKKSSKVKTSSHISRRLVFSTKAQARQSKTKRAGLVMSVARVLARLKAGHYSRRVGVTGAVYLAAVLEYLVAEVLDLGGNCARFFRKKRVSPRCIQLSLLHDKELDQLTRGVIVPQGGVRPYIHPVLLGKSATATVQGDGTGTEHDGSGGVEDQMIRRSYLEEEVEPELRIDED